MFETVKRELVDRGAKAEIVDIRRLQEIRADIEKLKTDEKLNSYQEYIADKMYVLQTPELEFDVRSMLIVAAPVFSHQTLIFNCNGTKIPLKSTTGYINSRNSPSNMESFLNELLNSSGFHVKLGRKPPLKRIAVRSGLCEYGRNNITYVEGMGSFYSLALFFTDLPSENETWREVQTMRRCENCKVCQRACPTGAIREDRFLIDNMKCLTYFNETAKGGEFPAWISKEAHNSVFECLRCQLVCPANKEYIGNTAPTMEFDAEETALLLQGAEFDTMPDALKEKIEALGWKNDLDALPRNLRVLL